MNNPWDENDHASTVDTVWKYPGARFPTSDEGPKHAMTPDPED